MVGFVFPDSGEANTLFKKISSRSKYVSRSLIYLIRVLAEMLS